MNSIAYIGNAAAVGRKLQSVLESARPKRPLIVYRTLTELTSTLSRSNGQAQIVILLAANQDELNRILEMRTLLRDRKIILILPDDSQESFARGCLIFPRYICDMHCNFMDVAAVLEKMSST